MGDYNTQIISAGLKRIDDDKLEDFKAEVLNRLSLVDSYYHATCPVLEVRNCASRTTITMVTQAKYNNGVEEFLDWLEPMVTAGLGPEEVWAINYSEYSPIPTVRKAYSEEQELQEFKDFLNRK